MSGPAYNLRTRPSPPEKKAAPVFFLRKPVKKRRPGETWSQKYRRVESYEEWSKSKLGVKVTTILLNNKTPWPVPLENFTTRVIREDIYYQYWSNPQFQLSEKIRQIIKKFIGKDPYDYRNVRAEEDEQTRMEEEAKKKVEEEKAKAHAEKQAQGEQEEGLGGRGLDKQNLADVVQDGSDVANGRGAVVTPTNQMLAEDHDLIHPDDASLQLANQKVDDNDEVPPDPIPPSNPLVSIHTTSPPHSTPSVDAAANDKINSGIQINVPMNGGGNDGNNGGRREEISPLNQIADGGTIDPIRAIGGVISPPIRVVFDREDEERQEEAAEIHLTNQILPGGEDDEKMEIDFDPPSSPPLQNGRTASAIIVSGFVPVVPPGEPLAIQQIMDGEVVDGDAPMLTEPRDARDLVSPRDQAQPPLINDANDEEETAVPRGISPITAPPRGPPSRQEMLDGGAADGNEKMEDEDGVASIDLLVQPEPADAANVAAGDQAGLDAQPDAVIAVGGIVNPHAAARPNGPSNEVVPVAAVVVPIAGNVGIGGQIQARILTPLEQRVRDQCVALISNARSHLLHEDATLKDIFLDFSDGALEKLIKVFLMNPNERMGPESGNVKAALLIQLLNNSKAEDEVVDHFLEVLVQGAGLAHSCSRADRFWCKSVKTWYDESGKSKGERWNQLCRGIRNPSAQIIFVPLVYEENDHLSLAVVYTTTRVIRIVDSRFAMNHPSHYGDPLQKFFKKLSKDRNWTYEAPITSQSRTMDDVRVHVMVKAYLSAMGKRLLYPRTSIEYMRIRAVIQIIDQRLQAH